MDMGIFHSVVLASTNDLVRISDNYSDYKVMNFIILQVWETLLAGALLQ